MAYPTKLHGWRPALRDAVIAACAAILAACGGGGGSSVAEAPSGPSAPLTPAPPAVPGSYDDTLAYSSLANASLSAPNENAAVIASHIQLGGQQFNYTATTGHLTATDVRTGKASASFFYVAYTVPGADPAKRPVTFFYNGGPGSASTYLHLGSFGPRRLVSAIPSAVIVTPQLVDNQETLLAQSDLVFVDAVGTGYSQAIAPNTNQTFWGVDADAAAFRDFVQRYIAVNKREASPKILFGESYGTPRTAVLANLLETAGVPVAALVLQSSIMDYNSNCGVLDPGAISCEGYIPTYAATSAYYQLSTPLPTDFSAYVQQARSFAAGDYRSAISAYLATKVAPPAAVVGQLVNYTGLPALTWQQNFDMGPDYYQRNAVPGKLVGRYDARVSAANGSALAAGGDPSLTVINSAFVSGIATYLGGELHYSARSAYISSNDIVDRWNFSHDGRRLPDTIPDLAAAMTLNPKMKVLAVNGYHDLATPFHQTELDLARLGANPQIVLKYYASGHMTYLDDTARRAQQTDLINFFNSVTVAQ
ncbi:peptidase S10 serine carboxypeptidase [Janthinobacterium sp. HH01]|uniref:S10 family peptidase n=1 Tax=Janthinobacterium sp. HH01 TaxID=1198452 RepID=UPI0002AEB995|nr:peptidase S10 serine carboxypeptidase [Janthinobacterium sp. HH01]ELX11884.1 peptidase S10 serine carboxypeptidase [Janthinobacterium sp. HH01]